MPLLDSFDGFIFDYGGVLVRNQSDAEQSRIASAVGLTDKEFGELYWGDRSEYDRGAITAVEYWHQIGASAGKILTPQQIEEAVELDNVTWMNFDTPMWDFVDQLKAAGKRVAILSNMPKDLGVALKSRTDRFQRFHHVTLSYEVNSVKPEPEIYEDCLRGIGTKLQKTVFFDDRIANVQGAELLGLKGIEFKDRDAVLAMMRG